MRVAVIVVLFWLGLQSMSAQSQMVDKIKLVDKTTGKFIELDKPSGLSTGVRLIFPTAAGAADQVLQISSVAGNDVTLGWVTMSAGSSTLSDRLTSSSTATPTGSYEPAGLIVPISANKKYRVTATVRGGRNTAGATDSDNIQFKLSGPANTSYVMVGVRCIDNTTITPKFASASGTSATTAALDPPDYDDYTYSVEGLVVTGSNSGNITLQMIATAGTTSIVEMLTHSNVVIREIE